MSLCVGSHLSRMLSPDLFSCSPCVCEYLGRGPRGTRGRAAPPPASSTWDVAGQTAGSGESARLPVLVCLINLRTGFLEVGSSRPLRSSRVAGKCSLRQMAEKRRVKPRGARGSAAGPIGGPLIRYYPARPPARPPSAGVTALRALPRETAANDSADTRVLSPAAQERPCVLILLFFHQNCEKHKMFLIGKMKTLRLTITTESQAVPGVLRSSSGPSAGEGCVCVCGGGSLSFLLTPAALRPRSGSRVRWPPQAGRVVFPSLREGHQELNGASPASFTSSQAAR